jgi:glutamyl-tRNA reductase
VEPTLAVIGLNFRTSPVAVRERFWIGEPRRYEALHQLVRSEGIEEVLVLATCNRTEFIVWANDVPSAANSVLRFLTHEYQLKLCDWSHFYRLMDDVALTHLFQVAAGLDSMVLGEPEIAAHLREAWEQARKAGTTGRFLDGIVQKALAVSARVRNETTLADSTLTVPYASVELSIGVLGDLSGREVLMVGAGRMSELTARCLRNAGATRLKVMNRTPEKAAEFALKLNATAVSCDDRIAHLKSADIAVCSTSCPHSIISLEDARQVARARKHRPLVMIDMAVPRDIDPRVGEVDGIHLFDLDDLERVVALRLRLDELCQQEVDFVRKEYGPFTDDQDQVLTILATHITQRISGSLTRELRDLPDRAGQDMLTVALHRLFQLESSNMIEAVQEN